jgi:solute carrier family 25 carnitine/acylcarnitine transporter 20/29
MDNYPNDVMLPYYKHYLSGAVSGMFGIILSHPVDTVKTHVQMGTWNQFKPNIANFYKGIKSPLLGVGFEKALVFGTYNYCNQGMGYNIPVSGAISGLTAAMVVTPYERWKILRQTSQHFSMSDISPGFLFKGLSATFTREVPGFAIYFSVYEVLKGKTQEMYARKINYLESFVYGGISGVTAWIFIYPQDRIKTIIQSSTGNTGSTGGIRIGDIMKDIYNKGGLKHFYSGFSWAVMRAMLLHSGTFCMMEIITNC